MIHALLMLMQTLVDPSFLFKVGTEVAAVGRLFFEVCVGTIVVWMYS